MQKRIPIATIKLAPGEAGYYDEYSRIYLSSTRPDAVIYSGTNCTQIKRSIKSGRLRLVSGGFDKPVTEPVVEQQTPVVTEEVKEVPVQEEEIKTKEEVTPTVVAEEQAPEVKEVAEAPVQEEEVKAEETPVAEEVVKEAPVKKSRRKNRKQETVETFVEETVAEENV
mgnify:CR=1 FL=1